MIATVLEILFAALILFGVWHREKLIAFEDAIETMAAKKVAEIVRRFKVVHAHWIHWAWYEECSNCGQEEKWTRKYCPGCGAKMDEVSE